MNPRRINVGGLVCFFATILVLSGCEGELLSSPDRLPSGEGIFLRSVSLVGGQEAPSVAPALRAPTIGQLGDEESGHFLVHFEGEAPALKAQLLEMGLRVETYLPHNAFLISATGRQARLMLERQADLDVDVIYPYHPAFKLAPEVAALPADGQETGLVMHLFPDADVEAVSARVRAMGLTIQGFGGERFPRLGLSLPADELFRVRNDLANMYEVFWIELRGEVRLHNDEAVPIIQSGYDQGPLVVADHGLHGEGQVIAVLDTGMDYDSCFFRDTSAIAPPTNVEDETSVDTSLRKVIAYDFLYDQEDPANSSHYDTLGHGTHVAGNAGGDNLAQPIEHDSADGVATAAKFVVQDGGYAVDDCADLPALGCPVVDLQPFFDQAYAQGARIHTNSWGDNENSSSQNTYSAGCQDVDTFMYEHPDFLLLFAAGNSGPMSGSVGSPSTAKNCISVGGTQNGDGLDTVISFSSRGPTTDGRLKPDVMAPASNTSAGNDRNVESNNCGKDTGAGTSYAAPLVAGAAALVRQYFTQGYYPEGLPVSANQFVPSAALVKAVLINSGISLERELPFPTMDQGWGRVALDQGLAFPKDNFRLEVVDGDVQFQATSDTPFSTSVHVADSSVPLKVTLVWTDPPSTPAAALNLVNDLDLKVSGGRRSFLGNVFWRGQSVPGGRPDTLNNVEQVLLATPRPGKYTVTVSPSRIVEGAQDFALVIRGNFE